MLNVVSIAITKQSVIDKVLFARQFILRLICETRFEVLKNA